MCDLKSNGGSPCAAKDLKMNMYQGKMNTRTKIFESKWVVHQEIVWSTHNIDTGMKENLTKLKEKSPCMQGEISMYARRNLKKHEYTSSA